MSRADPLAALGRVDPELLAGRALAVWESPERYDVLAKTLGCTPENLRNLHRDLSAALSFCMGGGTLVTSIPVVQMLKSTLAVAPLDLDCRIVYAAVHAPGDNPLVGAFVDCARAVAASGDNPWKHATPHASDEMCIRDRRFAVCIRQGSKTVPRSHPFGREDRMGRCHPNVG